jgi:Spy/CpxP family protein refolding chaperone
MRTLLACLATLLVAAPIAARAGDDREAPVARLERSLAELGLDDAQRERVQRILDAARPGDEEGHARLRDAYTALRELLSQDAPDETAVIEQAERIGQIKTERHKTMLRTLLAVRAELTTEQRERLQQMHAERSSSGRRRSEERTPDENAN